MIESLMNMDTNEKIVRFVINNIILLKILQEVLRYVFKKTPWAWDDDFSSFFGGLIGKIKDGFKNDKVADRKAG
jgi:hypothetical protein